MVRCSWTNLFLLLILTIDVEAREQGKRGSRPGRREDRSFHRQLNGGSKGGYYDGYFDYHQHYGESYDYYDNVDGPFYPARNLRYIKAMGINSEDFEWVNPDEIVKGGVTCGFLKADLGSMPDVTYPKIDVYVCMRFAMRQPAPKGYIFVHCGGPGSLSDCVENMGAPVERGIGENNAMNYNILAIDQRGMGRSEPSFFHEECSVFDWVTDEDWTLVNITLSQNPSVEDYRNETNIIENLQLYKARARSCWMCETCGFFFYDVPQANSQNETKSFHFLQHAGTRALAADIERMRILLDAPKMNLYGISYGTTVMAAYATIYPDSVGLFVVDSTTGLIPDAYEYAKVLGIGTKERLDYLVYSCEARNYDIPGACPVPNLRQCLDDLYLLLRSDLELDFISSLLTLANKTQAQDICNAAADGDEEMLEILSDEIFAPFEEVRASKRSNNLSPSQPSTAEIGIFGKPGYDLFGGVVSNEIMTTLVDAMDLAGSTYDERYFARKVVEFAEEYDFLGTDIPASSFYDQWSRGFYWPRSIPLPPFGHPSVKGIIGGSLWDGNTPYKWTQQMSVAFPAGRLLTTQTVKHGFNSIFDLTCHRYITDYFETGEIGFVEGTVCGAPPASECELLKVVGVDVPGDFCFD